MRLLLIRHGQSRANVEGVLQGATPGELTSLGRWQAAEVADRLAAAAPDLIVSSDLRRARDTAEAIAVATDRPVEEDARLREWDVGAYDGLHPDELLAAAARAGLPLEAFAPPGGERLLDVAVRRGTSPSGWPHGATTASASWPSCRTVTCSARSSGGCSAGGTTSAGGSTSGNASVTEFSLAADGWRVERVNDTSHLVGPAADAGA